MAQEIVSEQQEPQPIQTPVPTPTPKRSFWVEHWDLIAIVALATIGIGLRFWDLGGRAMHHDESLHAYYSWQLYVGRGYQHNPMMHGPFQFHFLAFLFVLLGDSEFVARAGSALFGVALIALPYFLRDRIGRTGAVVTSFLILVSPTLLYFSRFARNEMFLAVWETGLAICMWRYLATRKNVYLYITAALIALDFATKETSFITTVIFGGFLILLLFWDFLDWIFYGKKRDPALQEARGLGGVWKVFTGWIRSYQGAGPLALFVVYFTLSLPQGGALLSIIQKPLGIILANSADNWMVAPVGAPIGTGIYIAGGIVVVLLAVSALIGQAWNWKAWLICAIIFYSIYFLLYTTLLTNWIGFGSGVWQSLGYWLGQQVVARGGQPWYYYLLILPLYEFLPLLFAIIGGVYYAWRSKDPFNWFLIYWSVAALVLYTRAGEKMPWLAVHMALPIILLGGRFLGDVIEKADWRSLFQRGAAYGFLVIPGLMIVVGAAGGQQPTLGSLSLNFELWILVGIGAAIVAGAVYLFRRLGTRAMLQVLAASMFVILTVFTVRAALMASFKNGDTPVEMLVYTQTSPDVPRIMGDIQRLGEQTGQRLSLPITIDTADGFSWPWEWYLRDYKSVDRHDYSSETPTAAPSGKVLIIDSSNESKFANLLSNYGPGERIHLRWWFPEDYRDLTVQKLIHGILDPIERTKVWNFILYRQTPNPLGSVDAIVYFPKDFRY